MWWSWKRQQAWCRRTPTLVAEMPSQSSRGAAHMLAASPEVFWTPWLMFRLGLSGTQRQLREDMLAAAFNSAVAASRVRAVEARMPDVQTQVQVSPDVCCPTYRSIFPWAGLGVLKSMLGTPIPQSLVQVGLDTTRARRDWSLQANCYTNLPSLCSR